MSDSQSSNENRRKPRVGVWLMAAAVVGLLALLVALGIWQGWRNGQQARQTATIASAGEPLTANDLEAFYVYPAAGQDVTQLWLDGTAPFGLPAFAQATQNLGILEYAA